jgi:predicted nucleotidyltransferase
MMAVTPIGAARALVARFELDAQLAGAEWERVRERARHVAAWLRTQQGVARVFLVGSFAWGEPHAASDVDLVVDDVPEESRGAIEAECARRIGRSVELLRLGELDEGFRARVLSEGTVL